MLLQTFSFHQNQHDFMSNVSFYSFEMKGVVSPFRIELVNETIADLRFEYL